MERPYFLMGATTDPVYQWRWTSRPRRAFAGLARGIERFDTLPGAPAGEATYEHGEWRLVLTRALARSEEHTSELQSQSELVCCFLLEKKKKNRVVQGDAV